MNLFERFVPSHLRNADAAKNADAANPASHAGLETHIADINRAAGDIYGIALRENQIAASGVLLSSAIAELAFGEGKTFAAATAASFLARERRGVLICTANDYLARRDCQWAQRLLDRLGLRCGHIDHAMSPDARRAAYQCDVTYGTMRELGFDFLRDQLGTNPPLQRAPFAMIVDEADSLLIDEASMPLILSGNQRPLDPTHQDLYHWAADQAEQYIAGDEFETHQASGLIALTDTGRQRLFSSVMPATLDWFSTTQLIHAVERALLVRVRYQRGTDYLVQQDRIVIVDEFTGRCATSRAYGDGIQQAIQARENVPMTQPAYPLAQTSVQQFVSRFERLSGMTGTAWESRQELYTVYGLPIHRVPTDRPCQRLILPDAVYRDQTSKWQAIADETQQMIEQGRAVLIGTPTVDQSQAIAELLQTRFAGKAIRVQLLNASQSQDEAEIIAAAGQSGRVTVATNMAGRGTDIVLSDTVRDAGGLHVIAAQLHGASRIDRQLIGRSARCGDPGSARQFMAIDDDWLVAGFDSDKLAAIKQRWGRADAQGRVLRQHAAAAWMRRCQRSVERSQQHARRAVALRNEHLDAMYAALNLNPIVDRLSVPS